MTWTWVLVSAGVCYLLKLAGMAVPHKWLEHPRVRMLADMLPIALLASLVAIQTFTTGQHLSIDPRAGGLLAAVLAVLAKAPFLLVVVAAVVVTAGLRVLQ